MLTLLLLPACGLVTGPAYQEDFTNAFCGYQTRCGDPIALDECGDPKKLTFDECADFVARNYDQLSCEWNAAYASDCIAAYESLQMCPGDDAPQPEVCGLVYSGDSGCAVFPYPVCDTAPDDTGTAPADTGDTGT